MYLDQELKCIIP